MATNCHHVSNIDSTNELFDPSADKAVFKVTKKLERKPLIGSGQSSSSTCGSAISKQDHVTISTAEIDVTENSSDQNGSVGSRISLSRGSQSNYSNMSARTLKTIKGVFAPVSLSQFSSLLFLRVGFMIGNGGLWQSFIALFLSYLILLFTVLSICAISTNGAIEGGGAYYMISRTLGPQMGGAVGIVFYIANVFSCALYTSGCVEGLVQGIKSFVNSTELNDLSDGEVYLASLGILLLLFCLCLIGASMFGNFTYVFCIVVSAITLVVIITMWSLSNIDIPYAPGNGNMNMSVCAGKFTGPSLATLKLNLYPHYDHDYTTHMMVNFSTLFGVMFSGVTGIMAGANMSGELKNPGYSIPRGTLFACLFTFIVYAVLLVTTAATTENTVLTNNYVFMAYIPYLRTLVYIGIVVTTWCASLSNMIGASRVLRAIADDRVFGSLFTPVQRANDCQCLRCCSCLSSNSFLGSLILTFFLSAAIVALRDMNTIAPYTSVCFLLSYASVNLSCMMLIWAGAPNFRPKFKAYNMYTCLFGLLATLALMLYMMPFAALSCIAIFMIILAALYVWHLKHPPVGNDWGSVAQAVLFHTVRKYLLMLDFRREHVKFWRPHLLLLVSNPRTLCPLVDVLNDLKKSGIYILGHVMVSDRCEPKDLSAEYVKWQEYVDHLQVKAFVSLTESRSIREGALQVVRLCGLGSLRPNTVLLGFRDMEQPTDFLTTENSGYFIRPALGQAINSLWQPLYGPRDDCSGEFPVAVSNAIARSAGTHYEPPSAESPADAPVEVKRVTIHDFVGLLTDILSVGKSIVLCRNFQYLNKFAIMRLRDSPEKCTVDVWPINFICAENCTVGDTTSMFTLQLGTILNMVKFWNKNTIFRVVLIVPSEWTSEFLNEQREKVQEILSSVRITPKIVTVPFEEQQRRFSQSLPAAGSSSDAVSDDEQEEFSVLPPNSPSTGSCSAGLSESQVYRERLRGSYLSTVNKLIRETGKNAAITFLNIPAPPADRSLYPHYHEALERLSRKIGPCLMVHGISQVTTTNL